MARQPLHARQPSDCISRMKSGGLLLLFCVFVSHVCASAPSASALIATPRPLIIAHRGWSAVAPENTLPSFQFGLRAGADLVELDYHHTADGVPIVIHDSTVKRTTNASQLWPETDLHVAKHPLATLKTLDAGAWFDRRYTGIQLPTLAEALDCINAGSVTLIERKAGDPATLARLLKERSEINRVVVQSFDWDFLRELHSLISEQILAALGPRGRSDGRPMTDADKILGPDQLEAIGAIGARVAVWSRDVNAASIEAAHARDIKVWIYTIDDPAEMRRLFALGVDGIITNQTALAWRTLAVAGFDQAH